jgi:hypothetical protein
LVKPTSPKEIRYHTPEEGELNLIIEFLSIWIIGADNLYLEIALGPAVSPNFEKSR